LKGTRHVLLAEKRSRETGKVRRGWWQDRKGETGVIVNQNRRVRARRCVGEDPQKGFGKVGGGCVKGPVFRNRVLWARILFDISAGEERPTALVRLSLCGEGLRALPKVLT
jgi:hypothetical protein